MFFLRGVGSGVGANSFINSQEDTSQVKLGDQAEILAKKYPLKGQKAAKDF